MTADEEKAAIAETLTFAKEKGLNITWTNDFIVVIHASKKNLKESQEPKENQANVKDEGRRTLDLENTNSNL